MPRATTALAALLLALVLLHRPGAGSTQSPGVDFVQFWHTGRSAAAVADLYAPEGRAALGRSLSALAAPESRLARAARLRPVLETYSSPALYALFGAASSGHYERDLARYQRACTVLFAAGVVLAALACGLSAADGFLLAAFLVLFSFPLTSDEHVANVGRLQVAALGASALLLSRATPRAVVAGAAVLGFATLLKPNVVLAAAALLAVRVVRRAPVTPVVTGLALGALAALLLGAWWFGGIMPWLRWLPALASMPPEIIRPDMGNWGVVSLVAARSGRGTALLIIALPAVVASGWALVRDRTRGDASAIALGALAWLLVSPLTWLTDYLLAVPALVAGVARGGVSRGLALGGLLLLTTPPPAVKALTSPTTWCVVLSVTAALLMVALGAGVSRADVDPAAGTKPAA